LTQDSQEDKEKEMQNIIEDKDRISEKIGEFQKKYNQKSILMKTIMLNHLLLVLQ